MNDTITLDRAAYEALVDRLEDAEDKLALAVSENVPASHRLPLAQAQRIWDGEHPVRVWRNHRGLSGTALAALSGVPQSYISDIERGRKPGSVEAFSRLARALGVGIDQIIPELD